MAKSSELEMLVTLRLNANSVLEVSMQQRSNLRVMDFASVQDFAEFLEDLETGLFWVDVPEPKLQN
jgi:hypothetical protein